jgi:TolB-like protein/tetratricopeptide (TPR) repeat protein
MDRREQISRIARQAQALGSTDRAAFLAEACAGDDELRQLVDAQLLTKISPGAHVAHYRILDKLGAGGMGDVYRAHDEELDRVVAIKVLSATTFGDPNARQRLVREARAAAALNHPHICTVYQVGQANGQTFIAMELVEGTTLTGRLAAGALPPDQVVRFGIQLADALAHAHERGVIHRDLKSANVVVTPEGRVKVLDFGLAKRLAAPDLATELDATAMQPGTVAGTVPYMAPEQLRGQPAQAASDVWALGAVLYEMAEGKRPFQGTTTFELSAAILNEPPAPLAASVPAALQAVIKKCLEKEPSQRYKTGNDVRAALEVIQITGDFRPAMGPAEPVAVPPAAIPRPIGVTRRTLVVAASVAMIAAAAYAAWWFWPSPVGMRTLAILPLENLENDEAIDYVAEGLAESLIRQTARLPSMKVTSLRAVLSLKGQKVDVAEIGRTLRVESVVSGTVKRQGERLHITAELHDVASGSRLWSNQYDREVAQLLEVQDEMATAIMDDGLRVRLSNAERRQLVRHPTNNTEAYDLYLQAQHLQRVPTEEGYFNARKLLERAIALDPKFAAAYASLGGIHSMLVTDGYERPTDAWPRVSRYMRQALEIDPGQVEVLAFEHAFSFLFEWDWKAAERARLKLLQSVAAEVDPQFFRALALERLALGYPGEALALARRIRELDPLSPDLAMIEADYLLNAGQLDAAIVLYERSIAFDGENAFPVFGLAEAKFRQAKFDEAIALRRQAHELAGDEDVAKVFAQARGEEGYRQADRVWVQVQLEDLKRRALVRYVSPLDFARIYAQLGDKDQAFRYLDDAFKDRSPSLVLLNIDRAWDLVRDDPRFLDAVRKVGLPEQAARK